MLAVDRFVEFAKGARSSTLLVSTCHLCVLRFGRLHLHTTLTHLAAYLVLITFIYLLVETVIFILFVSVVARPLAPRAFFAHLVSEPVASSFPFSFFLSRSPRCFK